MKRSRLHRRQQRGAALLLVLAILVLVMGLVVGLLTRVTTERTASGGYSAAVSARLLGDSAVQIVQAQIGSATTQGTKVAWTSQPGLIRTFNEDGAPVQSYKLFSSPTMRVANALKPSDETAALASWFSQPAVFTDLNMPVDTDADGAPDTWPILDPSALGTPAAPLGFKLNSPPSGSYQGVTNPAPMPVQWLYVLKDGQMVAATGAGVTATITGASQANPIVGRIAFWTDDETCKVNVNTAAEGTYWDVPKVNTNQDRDLGKYQPVKNEFQAFPGHPATTSLSAVWPTLLPTPTDQTARDRLFALVPRLQNQGSKNGTVRVDLIDPTLQTLDQARLYATEDEILFSTDYSTTRQVNAGVDKNLLERSKFFITTTSRAPETTLFDTPRIVCWPINTTNTSDYRSAFDQLIAFCGTLASQPYYFQRQNANDQDEDAALARNQTLYAYLQTLTGRKVPGFGGVLATKFGDDNDQILTEIFDYIRCATLDDKNLPAKTGQFAKGSPSLPADSRTRLGYGQVMPLKIGATRGFGRMLTISQGALWLIATADPEIPASNDPNTNLTLAAGTPLVANSPAGTKQMRIEAAFVMEPFCAMAGWAGLRPDVQITVSGLEGWNIRGNADTADIPLQFPPLSRQTPTDAGLYILGRDPTNTNKSHIWSGFLGIRWFLDDHVLRARNNGRLVQDANFNSSPDGGTGYQKSRQYPFVGEPVTIKINTASPLVTCNSAPLVIKITNRQTSKVIQTLNMTFDAGTFPAPKLVYTGTPPALGASDVVWWTFQARGCGITSGSFDHDSTPSTPNQTVNGGRFTTGANGYGIWGYRFFNDSFDTVRAMVASTAGQTLDYRMLAATDPVPATYFAKHPDYTNTARRLANSFVEPINGLLAHEVYNYNLGTLANITGNYPSDIAPPVPYPASAAVQNGDWDNGIAYDMDGPYLNKPDEGNVYVDATSTARITPYFNSNDNNVTFNATFSSPNRLIPSAGMFGSLPTGVKRQKPWQTLLFRRQPSHPSYAAANGAFKNDADFLLLDLFWMPVVEPYAISEPLSTAGKINLNQQIIPFSYIERKTGLYAVLKNEKVMSIPATDVATYKDYTAPNLTKVYRRSILIPETLKQLDFRFDNTDGTGLYAFRSAAEICDMHLIPDDATGVNTSTKALMDAAMATYWTAHSLTGDNSREKIYTTVYPRLTTRSNTYTVYYRAQSLKQRPRTADFDQWNENLDVVLGDYRGSTTLDRYIDPNSPSLPDYAANPDATPTLDSLYRWRVRANKQFAP